MRVAMLSVLFMLLLMLPGVISLDSNSTEEDPPDGITVTDESSALEDRSPSPEISVILPRPAAIPDSPLNAAASTFNRQQIDEMLTRISAAMNQGNFQ